MGDARNPIHDKVYPRAVLAFVCDDLLVQKSRLVSIETHHLQSWLQELDQGNSVVEAEAPEECTELLQQLHHVGPAQLLSVFLPNLAEEIIS